MQRSTKLAYNSIFSLLHHFVAVVCGFILPRYILQAYGSDVNGLVASVTSFLGFITLAECGVGAVVQSALYKPLAEKDNEQVSRIIISAERFFRKIALLLLVYTAGLFFVYPYIVLDKFDYFYTASLVAIISIASLAQYYFSITYRLLLTADQMGFVPICIQTIALVLNTIVSVLLINYDYDIHTVKFSSSIIFLLQPFLIIMYTKRHYKLDKSLVLTEEPIKQKWNGLEQHIAAFILGGTDVTILTLLSSLASVSIYSIYYMVITGVLNIIIAGTNGTISLLGNMYARKEARLNSCFTLFEWGTHNATILIFTVAGFLIVPFVKLYTSDIKDANYELPLFAFFMCLAYGVRSIRMTYNIMVLAAGHYKETQSSAIVEAVLNIVISVVLVYKFDLIGVAIGTLIALSYRVVFFIKYLSKTILCRGYKGLVKLLTVDIMCIVANIVLCSNISINANNYFEWIQSAMIIFCLSFVVMFIANMIFYRDYIMMLKARLPI